MKNPSLSDLLAHQASLYRRALATFDTRRALCACVLAVSLIGQAATVQAQAADGPEVSAQIAQNLVQNPAPSTDTFGRAQFILSGDPLVPPRDYAKSLAPIQPQDYPANSAGAIYDVAFLGLENGQMQFEVRSYAANDLVYPAVGQDIAFPAAQKTITIRDLVIDIEAAEAGSLTYTVRPMP